MEKSTPWLKLYAQSAANTEFHIKIMYEDYLYDITLYLSSRFLSFNNANALKWMPVVSPPMSGDARARQLSCVPWKAFTPQSRSSLSPG